MAAEVKHQHILKCFEKSNAMAFLARITEIVLGNAKVADLCPARQETAGLRPMNEVRRSPRPSISVEFVCRGPVGPKV
jgi:hypothetical protein